MVCYIKSTQLVVLSNALWRELPKLHHSRYSTITLVYLPPSKRYFQQT